MNKYTRTIFWINNDMTLSLPLTNAILRMAHTHQANITIAHRVKDHVRSKVTVTKDRTKMDHEATHHKSGLSNDPLNDAAPVINELDVSTLTVHELAEVINNRNTWMVVSAYGPQGITKDEFQEYNLILSLMRSPLLLMPQSTGPLTFERISYFTDLRYCQMKAVRFMSSFSKPYGSDLLLAHRAAKGLPDMDEAYAQTLFRDTIFSFLDPERSYLSNIREKQIEKVVDVLVHGLKTQMLALVKDHHHYDETFDLLLNGGDHLLGEATYLIFPS